MKCEQVAERIYRHMQLGTAFALGAVISGAWAAFGRRPQRAAIDNGGRRLFGCQPALRLLIDRTPRRQIIGHRALGDCVVDHVAQTIEQFAQRMLPLIRVLARQRQPMRELLHEPTVTYHERLAR